VIFLLLILIIIIIINKDETHIQLL